MTQHPRIARYLMVILATLLMVGGLTRPALAMESGELLSDLHKMRMYNYKAMSAFYSYSASLDRAGAQQIEEIVKNADIHMNNIRNGAGDLIPADQLKALDSMHTRFVDLMNTNMKDVKKQGYPDLRMVSEMANDALGLANKSAEIYSSLTNSNAVKTVPAIESARKASLLMATMMTNYSARSNMASSQTFQGAELEEPIDVMAGHFEATLAELEKANLSNEKLKAKVKTAQSKWNFIRDSYIHYNENNVAFVIDRFSNTIITQLDELTDALLAGN